jgi:hypothetical protein
MADVNPIEDAINRIEVGIRQLKTQYDMYFAGAAPRQPFEVRKELEILIESTGKTRMQRFADRFRYNALASKYQTMTELWNKMIRAKEEGRLRPGIPGFVEPVKRTQEAVAAATGGAVGVAAPVSATAAAAGGPVFHRLRFVDPGSQESELRMFYDRFIEASRQSGGTGSQVSFSSFVKQVTQRTQAVRQKAGCEAVTCSIVIKDGGVKLRVSPEGSQEDVT